MQDHDFPSDFECLFLCISIWAAKTGEQTIQDGKILIIENAWDSFFLSFNIFFVPWGAFDVHRFRKMKRI